jgi:Na+/H+ antiporter NhaD/arsenite permease-like protein
MFGIETTMFFTLFVFVLAYIIIASEKFPRHWVALIGGGLLIVFGILSPYEAFSYINWETLGFFQMACHASAQKS